jgi:pantoate--beta-alanine ligase
LESGADQLANVGLDVQYLDLVDSHTFRALNSPDRNAALIVAAKLGQVRLIDNLLLYDAQ